MAPSFEYVKFLGSTPYPVAVANKGSIEFHKIAIILVIAVQPICPSYHDFARQSFDRGKEPGGRNDEKNAVESGMCVFSVFFSSL